MEKSKLSLVQIGSSEFPFGMAAIEKIWLIGLGLIAESYHLGNFVKKMQLIIDRPMEAEMIGQQGKVFGLKTVDCIAYRRKLEAFLSSLDKKAIGTQANVT